jgi:hypothetical protein
MGSEGDQKTLPGKASSVCSRSIHGAEFGKNSPILSRPKFKLFSSRVGWLWHNARTNSGGAHQAKGEGRPDRCGWKSSCSAKIFKGPRMTRINANDQRAGLKFSILMGFPIRVDSRHSRDSRATPLTAPVSAIALRIIYSRPFSARVCSLQAGRSPFGFALPAL